MAKLSKAEKKAQRLEAREKRRQASGEIFMTKVRIGAGFAGTYLVTQVALPIASTFVAENQGVIDGVTGVGLGIVAAVNDGPIGDVAMGGSLVGMIQSLDGIGTKYKEWRAKNP